MNEPKGPVEKTAQSAPDSTARQDWHGARSRAFNDNAQALRQRMAAERQLRNEAAYARRRKYDGPQNPTQPEPFSEARYSAAMAARGSWKWYVALCRRLAILGDLSISALEADPDTIVELTRRYEDCFQKGILDAVILYQQSADFLNQRMNGDA